MIPPQIKSITKKSKKEKGLDPFFMLGIHMNKSGITFIFSNVDFGGDDLPFTISASMTLRSATESEVELFNTHLEQTYGSSSRSIVPFNYEEVETEENGTKTTEYVVSDKPRWWVIAFNGTNADVADLSYVANLITPKLHFGSTFLFSEPNQKGEYETVIYGPHTKLEILSRESRKKFRRVSSEELNKLKKYYESIYLSDVDLSHVRYALDLYNSASGLWFHSGLLTLSLFSVIESLIAHKPRLTETLDSISHQIKHKINLLSKRFDIKADHTQHFGEIDTIKLWGKLYGLRSDIAHGQSYKFVGTYECLKSLENTNNFLDEMVRELIKLSINEPNLIVDIRDC